MSVEMEDSLARFAREHLRGGVALDIGANRGDYTLIFANLAQRVFAFEPHPGLAAALRTRFHERGNVEVIEVVVSDRCGARQAFHIDLRPGTESMASSLHVLDDLTAAGMTKQIEVEAITIDHFCRTRGIAPAFIKLDIEGAEPAALAGGCYTINTARPIIVFEMWESWFTKGYERIFADLSTLYRLTVLHTGEDAIALYGSPARPTGGVVDIACVPRADPITSKCRR